MVGQAGEHARRHLVLPGELHRADLQHLGAGARHLEHLLEGDCSQAPRLGHQARVGGVDAVDVGIDMALVGLQRRGQRHGRSVGAAAAERGEVAFRIHALEAGHHHDIAVLQVCTQFFVVNGNDSGFRESGVRQHLHLPAGVAARLDARLHQRHRQQADGHLLAGGGHHVELARVGQRLQLLGQRDQPVGLARHGRRHHHQVMPGGLPLGDAARDIADTLHRADRRPPEFLYD